MPSDPEGARVGCYSGGRYDEEPRWVEIGGARCPVREVESRWREPERDGWRVVLEDGRRLILYYDGECWLVHFLPHPSCYFRPMRS